MAQSLLADDEPAPFEFISGNDACPFVLIADHAANRIPRALGSLGLAADALDSHIAWDIGIEGVSRMLANRLGACLVLQRYSRLVIDCNRPHQSQTSIATCSAGIAIPGNIGLSQADIEQRRAEIFRPYHDRILAEIERRDRLGMPTLFIAMHSFTPVFMGANRSWHAGVLYQRDARLAHRVLARLRQDATLSVGDNQPYAVSDTSDYSIIEYGERRAKLHVEIEIRQDLIEAGTGQRAWAERLQAILSSSFHDLGLGDSD